MKINKSRGAAICSFLLLLSTSVVSAQTVARIAFYNYVSVKHQTGAYQIFSMNPDGSDAVQLTTGTNYSWLPSWSPGQHIAIRYMPSNPSKIRLADNPAEVTAMGSLRVAFYFCVPGLLLIQLSRPERG